MVESIHRPGDVGSPVGFAGLCACARPPGQWPRPHRPPGAAPGTCWDVVAEPALIETVTEQVLVAPASYNTDGTVYQAAQYRTEVNQIIVRERQETFFEIVCAKDMTPDFIATLQRALKARTLYRGDITGTMNAATRRAVRAWQKDHGADIENLTVKTARDLGLVAV